MAVFYWKYLTIVIRLFCDTKLIFSPRECAFTLVKTQARFSYTIWGNEELCVAAMELCVFRVSGFGRAPFYFRKKDDYEKSVIAYSGSGATDQLGADAGIRCKYRIYPCYTRIPGGGQCDCSRVSADGCGMDTCSRYAWR